MIKSNRIVEWNISYKKNGKEIRAYELQDSTLERIAEGIKRGFVKGVLQEEREEEDAGIN